MIEAFRSEYLSEWKEEERGFYNKRTAIIDFAYFTYVDYKDDMDYTGLYYNHLFDSHDRIYNTMIRPIDLTVLSDVDIRHYCKAKRIRLYRKVGKANYE